MDQPVLLIVMRVLHITAALVVVGGVTFAALCMRPMLKLIAEEQRDAFAAAVRRRFAVIQWTAIALLLVSGIYNWMISAATYRAIGPVANALIGTKVLVALILFMVVWLRGTGVIKSDKAAGMINIHLAGIVIVIAGVLRYLVLHHLTS